LEGMNDAFHKLEQVLGHVFNNKVYLFTALTHRSAGQDNNERLEYLGDALLGFIIADAVYKLHPTASEGELTRLRATLVKGETLASIARRLNLGNYLKLGSGELKSGGWRRKSILANTLEAIIGAIYLDAGMDTCRKFILALYEDLLKHASLENLVKDPKTRLQEYLQSLQQDLPDYQVITEHGEAHARIFTVQCLIGKFNISVQAEGRSKRSAEQTAAQMALDLLNI